MNELQWRKVELRPVYEEESRRLTAEFKSYQPQVVIKIRKQKKKFLIYFLKKRNETKCFFGLLQEKNC